NFRNLFFPAIGILPRSAKYFIFSSRWANILPDNRANPPLASFTFNNPQAFIPLFENACFKTQTLILESIQFDSSSVSVKSPCFVRFSRLPNNPSIMRTTTPNNDDIGKLIGFTGTVIRMGANKLLETRRLYRCSKCSGTIETNVDFEQYNLIPKPTICTATSEYCEGKYFSQIQFESENDMSHCIDYQEIKVQEQPNKLIVGSIPKSISVILKDDLVDVAKSGDNVTIIGFTIRRWGSLVSGQRPDISLCLVANNIIVHNNYQSFLSVSPEMRSFFISHRNRYRHDPIKGRDVIVSSVCPQIFGLYVVKLAVLLVLIGGVGKDDPSGLKVRGETHLLLVGDPGTAKSQFLNYAAQLSPRSVLTTGVGTTSAGLTVAAVRDGGEWMLEAGALVLADRGVCCIDEFSSIKESEKIAVHEAMEQQSVSGMLINLNARCSVLAATNPKGKYDTEQSIMVNVALGSPLLSRFDLILVLLDTYDREWDKRVSNFILDEELKLGEVDDKTSQLALNGTPTKNKSKATQLQGSSFSPTLSRRIDRDSDINTNTGSLGSYLNQTQAREGSVKDTKFTFDQLQQYIMWVKSQYNPTPTKDSEKILTRYYQLQRKNDSNNSSRTTIRLLESLIRISQAHARLMANTKVTIQDAVVTVFLFEASRNSSSSSTQQSLLNIFSESEISFDTLHSGFPENPGLDYRKYEKMILKKLDLESLTG
ncbi:hypothetical protein BB560_004977, partial [Smittium megazygosporum]